MSKEKEKRYDEIVEELLKEGYLYDEAEQVAWEEVYATVPANHHGMIIFN